MSLCPVIFEADTLGRRMKEPKGLQKDAHKCTEIAPESDLCQRISCTEQELLAINLYTTSNPQERQFSRKSRADSEGYSPLSTAIAPVSFSLRAA